jgi:hypothetical protein
MFRYIESNFLAGRTFKDWEDLNQQARAWCEKVNATVKRDLHARPIDLFAQERCALKPLPGFVPEVYRLHHRIVDTEGFVTIRLTRYSVPYQLIGRQLEVRETRDRMDVYSGSRQVASHAKPWDTLDVRISDKDHRPPRGEGRPKAGPSPEEAHLLTLEPHLADYVAALRTRHSRFTQALKRLLSLVRDYPRQSLLEAVTEALAYGMFDLDRLEGMVLRNVRRGYFAPAEGPETELLPWEETHEG